MGVMSELRRRNVLRMAMLYAVSTWLIMQVAEVIIGLGNLPQWIGPALLGLLALGLPIALVFSWFFELTPEGIKVDQESGSVEFSKQFGGRRLEYIVISMLAAAVLLFAYDKWWIGEPPEKSIAILPFQNMSANPEQEYFSDGLTETLMHTLAKVPELKVAARTSSFLFKGGNRDIREIGLALGVAHVLEGSVQRAAGRVRITAQLVRTDDGFNIWSESYDRNLVDIFGIQDDIANRVSDALAQSLLGGPPPKQIAGVSTHDVEAYDHYLNAITEQAKGSSEALQASEGHLKEALAKDFNFQEARIQLASNYFRQLMSGLRPPGATFREMIALLDQVLASRPDDTRARALMLVARVLNSNLIGEAVDFEDATAQLRALATEARSEVEPKLLLLMILTQMGEQEESLMLMKGLLELDPLNSEIHQNIGYAHYGLENWESARSSLGRSLELEPEQPSVHNMLGTIAQQTGDVAGMLRHSIDAMQMDPRDEDIPGSMAVALYQLGLQDDGDRFWNRTRSIAPTSPSARNAELHRAVHFDDDAAAFTIARGMIVDDVDLHAFAWIDALFTFFDIATRQGDAIAALEFAEMEVPGFSEFEQPTPYKIGIAQYQALGAFQQTETAIELLNRITLLDYFLNEVMFDGGGPIWRIQTLAMRGETEAAIDLTMTEIFSKPAIVNLGIDRVFSQTYLGDVAADPRIIAALENWKAEKARAAEVASAFLVQEKGI
jgi:TolB-like protein/Flp pilus assembly protein TadD